MNEIDVKKIREKLGLTQYEFAKQIGVDIRSVQRWEAGATVPTSKVILFRKYLDDYNSGGQTNFHGDNINGKDVKVQYGREDEMAKMMDLLLMKEKSLAKSQDSLAKSQEQIDRLIAIIESHNRAAPDHG